MFYRYTLHILTSFPHLTSVPPSIYFRIEGAKKQKNANKSSHRSPFGPGTKGVHYVFQHLLTTCGSFRMLPLCHLLDSEAATSAGATSHVDIFYIEPLAQTAQGPNTGLLNSMVPPAFGNLVFLRFQTFFFGRRGQKRIPNVFFEVGTRKVTKGF